MKNYNYIERVLSHISAKRRKAEVEAELFDHLDEKGKFFSEIGYDEAASFDKADGCMGDADIVGEQLDLIGKRFFKSNSFLYTFSGVSLILMILAYVLLYFYDLSGSFSSLGHYFLYSFSSFWSFCIFSVTFILGIINLLFGIKRKNAVSLIIGFIITETITVIGPYDYEDIIYSLFNKTSYNYIDSFFMQSVISLTPYNFNRDYQYILTSVFSCFFLVIFIFGLSVIIKTKRLKNTKNDLKIKKALTAIISAICVICFITSIAVIGLVIRNSKTIVERVSSEYCEMEQNFIDNIDSFITLDENKIDIAINKLIKDTGIPPIYEESSHNCIEWSNGYISIQEEFSDYDDNDNLSEYGIYFDCHVHNPFESYIGVDGYSFHDIYSNSKGDSKSIRTAPLPAAIGFHYSKDNCAVDFDYYASNANYFSKKIEYQYNFDTKEFELQYDLSANFENKVNLSEEQRNLLQNAICDYFFENLEISDKATAFGARGKYFWMDIYGAHQSETVNDLFKIDMSFTPYDIMITSGVNDYISFNNGEPILGATFFVEFKDNKAELIDWYYPEASDYASTKELEQIAKNYYNKASLKKLTEGDIAKLDYNPYTLSDEKELVNLQNIIREDYYKRYN